MVQHNPLSKSKLCNELQLHMSLSHPNVVQLLHYECYDEPPTLAYPREATQQVRNK